MDRAKRAIQLATEEKAFTTFLLLHGTGGNGQDLIPLAYKLDNRAAILSPRGKVLENGVAPRFFRRLAEGVFDTEDLKFRTNELADFVIDASKTYVYDLQHVIAMVPLVPKVLPDLSNKNIFMSSGLYDPIVSRQQAEKLFGLFKKTGANISLSWQESGHELTMKDIHKANEWLLSLHSSFS